MSLVGLARPGILNFLDLDALAVLGRVNWGSTEYTGMPDIAHIFMMGEFRGCSCYVQWCCRE